MEYCILFRYKNRKISAYKDAFAHIATFSSREQAQDKIDTEDWLKELTCQIVCLDQLGFS